MILQLFLHDSATFWHENQTFYFDICGLDEPLEMGHLVFKGVLRKIVTLQTESI